jgi:hypothetical protein
MSFVDDAEEIAIAEVKSREGWSGIASELSAEGGPLLIYAIRRKPGPTNDWREVTINPDGTVRAYEVKTIPIP